MLDRNAWNHLDLYKQISSNFKKIKWPTNYSLTNHMHVSKQMTDVKLLVLDSNTWNRSAVFKQMINIK